MDQIRTDIETVFKDWLKVSQGHPEAAALLTLTQTVLELFEGNPLWSELAIGIKAGLAGGCIIAGSGEEGAQEKRQDKPAP